MSLRRRRTRSSERSTTSVMSTGSCTTPPASSRVRSTRSPTSVDNSSICAITSVRSSARSCLGQSRRTRRHGRHQQFDVGAQRRQRGAQFVAGVGDQPGLAFTRFGQRTQHHVESLGEPGQFVAAEHRDGPQIVGARHPLGRFGEPGHRPQPRPGDHAAGDRGHRHADAADDQQHRAQLVDHRPRSVPGSWRSAASCRWAGARPAPADWLAVRRDMNRSPRITAFSGSPIGSVWPSWLAV